LHADDDVAFAVGIVELGQDRVGDRAVARMAMESGGAATAFSSAVCRKVDDAIG
jgi:hypothetical protein